MNRFLMCAVLALSFTFISSALAQEKAPAEELAMCMTEEPAAPVAATKAPKKEAEAKEVEAPCPSGCCDEKCKKVKAKEAEAAAKKEAEVQQEVDEAAAAAVRGTFVTVKAPVRVRVKTPDKMKVSGDITISNLPTVQGLEANETGEMGEVTRIAVDSSINGIVQSERINDPMEGVIRPTAGSEDPEKKYLHMEMHQPPGETQKMELVGNDWCGGRRGCKVLVVGGTAVGIAVGVAILVKLASGSSSEIQTSSDVWNQ